MGKKKRDAFLMETIRGERTLTTEPTKETTGQIPNDLSSILKAKYNPEREEQFCHTLSARIPVPLYKKIDQKAHELHISVSELVRDIIEHGVRQL